MILWPPLDVCSSCFRSCCCAKGLWLSLCNIVWSGVHSLALPFLILSLFCVVWGLCESTTPIVAAFARQFWVTIAALESFPNSYIFENRQSLHLIVSEHLNLRETTTPHWRAISSMRSRRSLKKRACKVGRCSRIECLI